MQHGECSYAHNNTPTAQPLTSPPRLITLSEQNSHRVRRYSLVRRDPTSSDKAKNCRQGLCRTGSAAMTMRPTLPGSSRHPGHGSIPCRSKRPSGSGDKALSVPSDKNTAQYSRIIVLECLSKQSQIHLVNLTKSVWLCSQSNCSYAKWHYFCIFTNEGSASVNRDKYTWGTYPSLHECVDNFAFLDISVNRAK